MLAWDVVLGFLSLSQKMFLFASCKAHPALSQRLLQQNSVGERWELSQLPAHCLSSILAQKFGQEKCLVCSVAEETQPKVG